MTDRVVHAKDLDGARGLTEDGNKAYAKIDGVTIKFNAAGQMVAQVPTTTTASVDPTVAGVMDGDEWLVLTNGVITKQWVWDIETSSWYARPAGGGSTSPINWSDTTTNPIASGNTGTLPRYVNATVAGVNTRWLVDSNGVAKQVYQAPTPLTPELAPVRDFKTQAQIDALAAATPKPNDQTSYIVKDGTHKGDIATWDEATSAWIYYVPADLDVTTVTNPDNEVDLGKWRYDKVGDYWVQIASEIVLPEVVERPVSAENIAFGRSSHLICNNVQSGGNYAFIQNDEVAIWGNNPYFSRGTNQHAEDSRPRIIPFTWFNSNPSGGTYAPLGQYAPKFVDVVHNWNTLLALDHLGKVWWMGGRIQGSGQTTTPTGTTAVPWQTLGLSPVSFWQAQTNVFAARIYINNIKFDAPITVSAVVTTDGDLYLTGDNQYGELGQGNTTVTANWVKYPKGNIVDVKMIEYTVLALDASGDLWVTGYLDIAGGTTTNITPRLLLSGVANFDIGVDSYGNNVKYIMAVKTDSTVWGVGRNNVGQLGIGNFTDQTTFKQAVGVNNAKTVFCGKYSIGGPVGIIRTDGTGSFTGQNLAGVMGYGPDTATTNHATFVTPAFAAQGTIIEGMIGRTTHLRTATGAIWNAGYTYMRGLGFDEQSWTNSNKFQQVPLPEGALAMRGRMGQAANNVDDGVIILTANHGIIVWGGSYVGYESPSDQQIIYTPARMSNVRFLNNGIAVTNPLGGKYDTAATVSAITAGSITGILDGVSNQYVSVTLTTNGTVGKLDTSGATLTGSDLTATIQTSYVYQTATSGNTIKLVFKLNATDAIPVGGAAINQAYTITVGGQTYALTGSRANDVIADTLTTNQSAYLAASTGDYVPITAAEYTALQTGVTGSALAGKQDAASTYTALGDWGEYGLATSAVSNATNSAFITPIPANNWVYAFSFKTGSAQTGRSYDFGINAQGSTTNWNNLGNGARNITNTAGEIKYFVIKGGALASVASDMCMWGGCIAYHANGTVASYYNGGIGAGTSPLSNKTIATGWAQTPYIQSIYTPTKQWA